MTQKNIYAKELGIDLAPGREDEYFKWFLACLLFWKPVQQEDGTLASPAVAS